MKLANVTPKDRPFVPILMFVDAKGFVRVQMFGNDPLLEKPERIIRDTVRELMKEPGIIVTAARSSRRRVQRYKSNLIPCASGSSPDQFTVTVWRRM